MWENYIRGHISLQKLAILGNKSSREVPDEAVYGVLSAGGHGASRPVPASVYATHTHTHTLSRHIHIYRKGYICMHVHINMFNTCPYLPVSLWRAAHCSDTVLQQAGHLGHPGVHPHPLYWGALSVLGVGGSAKHNWRMEVTPGILPVAAIVGAAGAAQTVHGWAPHVLAGLGRLLLEAGWGHAIPGRWDWFWLNVDVLVGVNG